MKLRTIIGTVLILALLITAASAQTENKDLPTEQEITTYLSGLQLSSNFVASASEASINDNPAWKWDTWTDGEGNSLISFYYTTDSTRGYGSVYYDDSGKPLNKMCGIETTLVKSYAGEEAETVKETPIEEVTETEKRPASEEGEEIVTEIEEPVKEVPTEEITETNEEEDLDIHYTALEIKEMNTQDKLSIIMKIYNMLMGE